LRETFFFCFIGFNFTIEIVLKETLPNSSLIFFSTLCLTMQTSANTRRLLIDIAFSGAILSWARQLCGLFGYVEMLWCSIIIFFSFLQVIYSTTHWLRTWAILQKHTLQDKLVAAFHFLAQVAKFFFARADRWRFSLRIDSH